VIRRKIVELANEFLLTIVCYERIQRFVASFFTLSKSLAPPSPAPAKPSSLSRLE
jgi:hypothetical protein